MGWGKGRREKGREEGPENNRRGERQVNISKWNSQGTDFIARNGIFSFLCPQRMAWHTVSAQQMNECTRQRTGEQLRELLFNWDNAWGKALHHESLSAASAWHTVGPKSPCAYGAGTPPRGGGKLCPLLPKEAGSLFWKESLISIALGIQTCPRPSSVSISRFWGRREARPCLNHKDVVSWYIFLPFSWRQGGVSKSTSTDLQEQNLVFLYQKL